MVQPVQADAVAAFTQEVAGEDIGAHIAENIDLLEFHHHGAARHRLQAGIEIQELRRQHRRNIHVDREGAGDRAVVVAHQQRQHAAVQRLRQMLEQPRIGADIIFRQHRVLQVGDRDVELLEHRLRRHAWRDRADRLPAHQVRHVGARQELLQLAQLLRLDWPAAAALGGGLGVGGGGQAGLALALPVHFLGDFQHVIVLALHIVPGAEFVDVLFLVALGQRVLAEQEPHLHDGGVDVLQRGALADEEDVGIRQDEGLALVILDDALEGRGGDADVMVAPVVRPQTRQVQMHGRAVFQIVAAQALQIVQQHIFLAGTSGGLPALCCLRQNSHLPLPDLRIVFAVRRRCATL